MEPSSLKPRVPPPLPIVCVSDATEKPSTSKEEEPRMSASHQWLEYRDERTSSSSSDSGVALQFSPPNQLLSHSLSSVLALSPPGLSPLTAQDSPFSTPTSAQASSRFTFDHVPFRRQQDEASATVPPKAEVVPSAFDIPTSSKNLERLNEVLAQVRKVENNGHSALTRKRSVIQSTTSEKMPLVRTGTSPLPSTMGGLSVSVADSNIDRMLNGSQLLLGAFHSARAHCLLSPSLSSPLSTDSSYFRLSPNSDLQKSPHSVSSDALDDDDKKQFYCEHCLKDFKRPDILSRHLRRHTGEKPFGCHDCGRFFSRSDHLRTHRRTHTDEKPYQCTICPYAARRRDVLTRHMSTRHQAKAGASIFQKHRDVRRCLSDGDGSLAGVVRSGALAPPPNTPKRVRHSTDVPTMSPAHVYRHRTHTEAYRERLMTESSGVCDFPSSLNEMENDVIEDENDAIDDGVVIVDVTGTGEQFVKKS